MGCVNDPQQHPASSSAFTDAEPVAPTIDLAAQPDAAKSTDPPQFAHASPRFRALDPAKRATVLDAACREFAAHGYRGASTNRIAASARVSKGALFSYFPAKDDLFAAVVEELFEHMQSEATRVASVGASRGLFAALRERALLAMEFHKRSPQLFAIYAHLLDRNDELPAREKYLARYNALSRDLYVSLLGEARTAGELAADVNPQAALLIVDAALRGLFEALVASSETRTATGETEVDAAPRDYERLVDDTMLLVQRALGRTNRTES